MMSPASSPASRTRSRTKFQIGSPGTPMISSPVSQPSTFGGRETRSKRLSIERFESSQQSVKMKRQGSGQRSFGDAVGMNRSFHNSNPSSAPGCHSSKSNTFGSPLCAIPIPVLARLSARREAAAAAKRARLANSGSSTPTKKSTKTCGYGRVAQLRGGGPTWSGLVNRKRSSRSANLNQQRESPCPPSVEREDSALAALSSILIEIEQPTGVLRLPLTTETDIIEAKSAVLECKRFITDELPTAAKDVGKNVSGPTFQALLCWGYEMKSSCGEAARDQGGSAMYAVREDRTAGADINLDLISPQRLHDLARKAAKLVDMLRIKIEDDGDLCQASKTLRDIDHFFEKLSGACSAQGITDAEGLYKLRML